ncbi:MAG TPA: YIP1 family protein [Chthoniobacterales bacterium]|nr:YIP1 family protein [Chthoniobacterales bacterium]
MAMIHVARDGAKIGEFSREEIREGLRAGKFLPTDMAWEEGMSDWRPLSQVVTDEPAAAAAPAPGPAYAGALPISDASDRGLPWEHRQELGLVKAFFDTVVLVLTKPNEAFGMMKSEGGLTDPLLFALIGGSIGLIVSFLFQVGLQAAGFMADGQTAIFGMGMGIVFQIILMPVMLFLGMFIWSGILHLCLMLVGGARRPFETTFRVVCFSTGSTYLLALIPVCGGPIATVYNIVLECMGLARAHETEISKAVMAVLLPILVCCGGLMLIGLVTGFSLVNLLSRG